MTRELKRGSATALIALVQKLSLQDEVDDGEIVTLIHHICDNPSERAALLLALRRANDPDLALLVCDRIRLAASSAAGRAETLASDDSLLGPLVPIIGGGLTLFSITSAVTGTVSGLAIVPLFLAPLAFTAMAIFARRRLHRRRIAAKSTADQAGDLLKSIGEIKPDPTAPSKTQRK